MALKLWIVVFWLVRPCDVISSPQTLVTMRLITEKITQTNADIQIFFSYVTAWSRMLEAARDYICLSETSPVSRVSAINPVWNERKSIRNVGIETSVFMAHNSGTKWLLSRSRNPLSWRNRVLQNPASFLCQLLSILEGLSPVRPFLPSYHIPWWFSIKIVIVISWNMTLPFQPHLFNLTKNINWIIQINKLVSV